MRDMGWRLQLRPSCNLNINHRTIERLVFDGGRTYFQPIVYEDGGVRRMHCGYYMEEWQAALVHDLVICRQACERRAPINTRTDLNYNWEWLVTFRTFCTLDQFILPQLCELLRTDPSSLIDEFGSYEFSPYQGRDDDVDDEEAERRALDPPHIKYYPQSLPRCNHMQQNEDITPSPLSHYHNIGAIAATPTTHTTSTPSPQSQSPFLLPLSTTSNHNKTKKHTKRTTANNNVTIRRKKSTSQRNNNKKNNNSDSNEEEHVSDPSPSFSKEMTPLPTIVSLDHIDENNRIHNTNSVRHRRYNTRSTPSLGNGNGNGNGSGEYNNIRQETRRRNSGLRPSPSPSGGARDKRQKRESVMYNAVGVPPHRLRKQVTPRRSFFV